MHLPVRLLTTLLSLLLSLPALAYSLNTRQVTENVYALVGETGPRTYENYGLNNNMGFIVTTQGVVLIDSGTAPQAARIIEKAVAEVTSQPIRWLINTGSQDHRWLGNGYFADKGVELIALERTVATQKQVAAGQIENIRRILKDRADGLEPVHATNPYQGDVHRINLGGTELQVMWLDDAHFPGDTVVWLPRQKVLFSGDLVYVDRLLGILPQSPIAGWRNAFRKMEQLAPVQIIPGHGEVCDLDKASRETADYLTWLSTEVAKALDDWMELDETVDALSGDSPFSYLKNYELLHRANINRTYLQLEAAR